MLGLQDSTGRDKRASGKRPTSTRIARGDEALKGLGMTMDCEWPASPSLTCFPSIRFRHLASSDPIIYASARICSFRVGSLPNVVSFSCMFRKTGRPATQALSDQTYRMARRVDVLQQPMSTTARHNVTPLRGKKKIYARKKSITGKAFPNSLRYTVETRREFRACK